MPEALTETGFRISDSFVEKENGKALKMLEEDYRHLGGQLSRRGIDIEEITRIVQGFTVAVPSWGVGTGGTRFGRFPGEGEPRNVYEKLVDCSTIHQLTRAASHVSLHIPWDKPDDPQMLLEFAREVSIGFDAMNSNTFQDQTNQKLSYKFGSLTHADEAVRRQAIDHNIECIEIGKTLKSKALSVWIGDGGNFPGQVHFRRALERYIESLKAIYRHLPNDWRLFIEHKLCEPAFYSTVLNDWGTSYFAATAIGPKCLCLVDLGHHAPNTNIEMVVSRLIQFQKLAGFHFNDSKYGDDDLDAGSIRPFQLFLVFNELVGAESEKVAGFDPAYMIDQSHNVTDPVESLISSTEEIQRAYCQALLVDRKALSAYQESNDALMALKTLKTAYNTDVEPIISMSRYRNRGAINPISTYRASGYREEKAKERPATLTSRSGIV
ncbi:MAG: L-rhamnose catabolism isomerase [Bacteroidota bacterium]